VDLELGVRRHKHVPVVGPHLQRKNLRAFLFRYLPQYLLQAPSYIANEDWFSALRAPDEMIVDQIDLVAAAPVFHLLTSTHPSTDQPVSLAAIHPQHGSAGLSRQRLCKNRIPAHSLDDLPF
jgi:hypothetical protein